MRDVPYPSSLLSVLFQAIAGVEHGCVISRALWSWVSWLIWLPPQDNSHTLPLTTQKEPHHSLAFTSISYYKAPY